MSAQLVKIFNAYDESLNKAHSKNYNLSIQLSLDGFSFTLFNTLNGKFLSLESVELNHPENPLAFIRIFSDFVTEHPWLKETFGRVSFFYETSRSTLVPAPLYHPDDESLLARFNFEIDEDMEVLHDRLNSADAYLLYAIPGKLKAFLETLFPGHTLKCHAAILIEALMILYKNQPSLKRVFVNVRNAQLDVVITEGNQLLFYNAFSYHSKQDFIYYIIFVLEQLSLNPEEIELTFSGRIDRKSTLYDMAWKYIRNIRFQELSPSFRYSYLFNDIPAHSYFTLLNSGLCEL
jgi:hypothetical protein